MRSTSNGAWIRRTVTILLAAVWWMPTGAFSGTTERASIASDGAEGNSVSSLPGISADGRYVVFTSSASNLVPDDTNAVQDVFVRDRQTGTTERVSVASEGTEANDHSFTPVISANGRFVAFHTAASNLVPGDTNGARDIFVHDRQIGTTDRVSVTSDGMEGNDESFRPSLSADGQLVAFSSDASNLVPGDTNDARDDFVHDQQTGTTERVSVASDGSQHNGLNFLTGYPVVSADGRYVVFHSDASNLVPADNNDYADIFVRDRQTGTTERVSVASDGTEANHDSGMGGTASISADGRFVAFGSAASNLVPDDMAGVDTFVHDRETGITQRVSVAADGTESNGGSGFYADISADGRFVVFENNASNLVPDDTNGTYDIFVHDRITGAIERVSITSDGIEGNGASSNHPMISADGRFVAFPSQASNLVSNDTNGALDVFVHSRTLTVAPDVLDFGPVRIGQTSDSRSLELTNLGAEEVTIQAISDPDTPFTRTGGTCDDPPFTLASMESCELGLTFSPITQGPSETTMTITSDDSGSPHTVILQGFGSEEPLHVAPDPLAFGGVIVGETSTPRSVILTNADTAALEVTAVSAPAAPFSAVAGTCGEPPFSLDPFTSCTIRYIFQPAEAGSFSEIAEVTSDAAGSPHSFVLEGDGLLRELTVTPELLDFGGVAVGETAGPLGVTLANTGEVDVSLSDVADPAAPFTLVENTCDSTLPSGTSCTLDYSFTPSSPGEFSIPVTIESNAPSSPDTVTLQGTGLGAAIEVNPDSLEAALDPGQMATQALTVTNAGNETLAWEITEEGQPPATAADCNSGTGILVHDDGTVENAYSGNPDSISQVIFADRFTPSVYPTTFSAVCVSFARVSGGPSSLDFEIVIFDDDGPGGGPGTELSALAATVSDLPVWPVTEPTWARIDISSQAVTVDSGSIYIGARWAPSDPNVFLTADQSPGNPPGFAGGYWWSDDVGTWTPIQEPFPDYRSLFVRAVADAASVDCTLPPWVNVAPQSGSISAGEDQDVEVTFDATDVAPGDYAANVCLSSNDPVRPLTSVPLALTVTGGALTFDPTSLDFGDVEVGTTSSPRTATLRNTGNVDATDITFTLPGSGFDADTSACADTLPAGESCPVSVTFTPAETGPTQATLTASGEPGVAAGLDLSGLGVIAGGAFTPVGLSIDPGASATTGNGIFEPGEQVSAVPAWRNDATDPQSLSGITSDFGGPAGAIYSVVHGAADYGLIEPGQTASCLDTGVCYELGVDIPAVRPATHWEATFNETLGDADGTVKTWTLHIGESFTDVPTTNLFYSAIETLLHHGVTGGCSDGAYCPGGVNSRGQMPVFVLRALEGPDYVPPACSEEAEEFADVPATSPFCPWIEELFRREVISGCGGGNYCPGAPVTRAQMAIFLLRTLEGADYSPPECSSRFDDVPCPSLFADWIEDLAGRGITGGCTATTYCPGATVSRAQMAVFITKAFGFTLYGP